MERKEARSCRILLVRIHISLLRLLTYLHVGDCIRVSHYYVLVPDHLAIVIVTFYENEGFSYTSFRDYSRNQNLGVLSCKHAGHIWKVICQLPKIVYREVEKK